MSDIFVSYAREDRPRVKPLVEALQQRGWSIWWDPIIPPGKRWDDVIDAALNEARCVVVLWSRKSVQSHWVRTEANEGMQRRILVPALLDDVTIPLAFRLLQAANLVGWSAGSPNAEFDSLLHAVSEVLSEAPLPTRLAGETRQNPKDGLVYVWIPPGKFTMGCSPGDNECWDQEKPLHSVTIRKGFWMGQTPVTQEAYQKVMGNNPSHFKGAQRPVESVSWNDSNEYCGKVGLRLPTEAEWEYAARAGTIGARYGDLDKIAWYKGNNAGETKPVRGVQPNAWGLYDMLGNVWEWTGDWYGAYDAADAADPVGPASGEYRVVRGGSWSNDTRVVRASLRVWIGPAVRSNYLGFRCVGEFR